MSLTQSARSLAGGILAGADLSQSEWWRAARATAALVFGVGAAAVQPVPAIAWALLGMQAIDFVSAVVAASSAGQVDSDVGWRGIARKVFLTWCVVGAAFLASAVIPAGLPLPQVVMGGYIGVEGMSIVENAGRGGLWVPGVLRRAFARLRDTLNGDSTGSTATGGR